MAVFNFMRARRARRLLAEADAARDRSEWRAAADGYCAFLSLRPKAAGIWVQYGHALKEMEEFSGAQDAYEKALSLAPDVADTHVMLGHLMKMTRRLDEASGHYARAVALAPEELDPLLQLAFAEKDLGRLDAALEHFQAAQKLDPGNGEVAGIVQMLSRPALAPRAAARSRELESAIKAMALEIKRQRDRTDRVEVALQQMTTALAVLENDLRAGRVEIERRLIQVEAQSPEIGARFQALLDHVQDMRAAAR